MKPSNVNNTKTDCVIKYVVNVVGRWTCHHVSPFHRTRRSLSVPVSVMGVKWYDYLDTCVTGVDVESSVNVEIL